MATRSSRRKITQPALAPASSARSHAVEMDVNYTVPALIAMVAVVLLTALFFSQPSSSDGALANTAGQAAGMDVDSQSTDTCEAVSYCEGSKLIRRASDCNQYVAYCQYGCAMRDGHATCN